MATSAARTSSIADSLHRKGIFPSLPANLSLPVSQADPGDPRRQADGLRRRLSASFSLHLRPLSSSSASWVRRSKSMSEMMGQQAGSSLKRWWDWGWSWIMSRKPTFARDLEMNDEESSFLGSHSRGTWRHVFYKVRSELRKLWGSDARLPTTHQTFRYDALSYARNFDDGSRSLS